MTMKIEAEPTATTASSGSLLSKPILSYRDAALSQQHIEEKKTLSSLGEPRHPAESSPAKEAPTTDCSIAADEPKLKLSCKRSRPTSPPTHRAVLDLPSDSLCPSPLPVALVQTPAPPSPPSSPPSPSSSPSTEVRSPSTSPSRKFAKTIEGKKRRDSRQRLRATEGSSKKVSFAEELVSDVWTRPRTRPEEVRSLFYSAEDEARFREETYLENLMGAKTSIPETCEDNASDCATSVISDDEFEDQCSIGSIEDLLQSLDDDSLSDSISPLKSVCLPSADSSVPSTIEVDGTLEDERMPSFLGRRSSSPSVVSRAVVRYGGTVKTFYSGTSVLPSCGMEAQEDHSASGDLPFDFDDPAFWNGTVTWY